MYFDAATDEVSTIEIGDDGARHVRQLRSIDPSYSAAVPIGKAVSWDYQCGCRARSTTWEAALDRFGTTSLKE